jgi:signal transduction histidine kinase
LCTFLPLSYPEGKRWLLLAGDPSSPTVEAGVPFAPMRSFLRGLGHLLNHYVMTPQSLAEAALDRDDLPSEAVSAFEQILDRCQAMGRLLATLQDLATTQAATEDVSLPDLVREFIDETMVGQSRAAYELDVDLPEAGFLVRVNRRMIKTALRNLFTNAQEALLPDQPGRIRVRVFAQGDTVGCSVTDNGEGLPTEDWVQLLAPFASTKGPFARDARHAAMDAAGLGLSVSRHLLALHGGRLELRAQPDGGTSAVLFLPRAGAAAQTPQPSFDPVTAGSAPAVEVGNRHGAPETVS